MRILVVQESDWLSKGPHQQHHLMERLAERGHEIRVIDFEIGWRMGTDPTAISKREIHRNVSKIHNNGGVMVIRPAIVKVPLLDVLSISVTHTREIARQIREFSPDIIIGLGILNNLIASLLARISGIPFAVYLLDEMYTLAPYDVLRSIGKAAESQVLRSADAVFVINEKLKEYAISLGADSGRTYVVRAGVDSDSFNPHVDGSSIRKEHDIGTEDIVLFYMGTIFDFSGIKEVALDLARASHKYPNLKLLVAGWARSPQLGKELNEIMEDNRLQDRFFLEPRQPYERIPSFIAAADICLLPAYENDVMRNIVPIKMYEYMISGKPVVSTRLPGVIAEFGNDHGVVYAESPEGVIAKIIELIDKRVDLRAEGLKARNFVSPFTWQRIVGEFASRLEELIRERKGSENFREAFR